MNGNLGPLQPLAEAIAELVADRVYERIERRMERDEWLTMRDAARYAKVSYHRLVDAANRGELRTVQHTPNGKRRVRRSEVDRWLAGERNAP
ncbi:helix-turn-helix domain-containing protein [Thermoleophilum album]|uniref:DNA binding domain-containing protein, excisionase family n=1 Tax=Thermoleophilum album TaxID=29539 RepID=A0A1H6FLR2_THEAL|nr:helix-turn-helix domain-containing protein [Thermoleophilum album]SEH10734.1 DNA binding domain-containing protein, excisionase family [Thermoleophilum album]